MKISQIISTLKNLHISKDKLLLLMLGGVLLIIVSLPVKGKSEKGTAGNTVSTISVQESAAEADITTVQEYARNLETGLEEILSKAEGAGKVKVFITFKDSGELIVGSNVSESTRVDGIVGQNIKTGEVTRDETVVFVKGSDGTLTPYVTKRLYPAISGVLVLAQGASDAEVTAAITEAVSAVLGIDINKIKVMKMEG